MWMYTHMNVTLKSCMQSTQQCICTYMHTYTCAHLHIGTPNTWTHTHVRTYHAHNHAAHTCTRLPEHKHSAHTYSACTSSHICMEAPTQTCSHVYVYAHMHISTQGSNAQICTHMQTHRHAYTHTHGRHATTYTWLEVTSLVLRKFL